MKRLRREPPSEISCSFAASITCLRTRPHGGTLDASDRTWNDLGVYRLNVGDVLKSQGNLVGALNAYQEAATTRERLGRLEPKSADWQSRLAFGYVAIADTTKSLLDLTTTTEYYIKAFAIRDGLANLDPENADWQTNRAWSEIYRGDMMVIDRELICSGIIPSLKLLARALTRVSTLAGSLILERTTNSW
jgi:hypothetical protein